MLPQFPGKRPVEIRTETAQDESLCCWVGQSSRFHVDGLQMRNMEVVFFTDSCKFWAQKKLPDHSESCRYQSNMTAAHDFQK